VVELPIIMVYNAIHINQLNHYYKHYTDKYIHTYIFPSILYLGILYSQTNDMLDVPIVVGRYCYFRGCSHKIYTLYEYIHIHVLVLIIDASFAYKPGQDDTMFLQFFVSSNKYVFLCFNV
jgi:hypothetical protein